MLRRSGIDTYLTFLSIQEMVDVMGGSDSACFAEYEDLCVLAFLAVCTLRLQRLHHMLRSQRGVNLSSRCGL